MGAELREASINYKYFHASGRDPYLYRHKLKEGLSLNLDIDLGKGFFWDSLIETKTDPGSYRYIGYNFKLGFRLIPSLDIQYEHFSKHLMEDKYPHMGFPVEDSLGLKWRVFTRPEPRRSLF